MHEEQRRALDYLNRKGTLAPAAQVRQRLGDAFAAVEAAFDGVEAADRERPPTPGKWSPHEILDHLVLSHGPAVPQLASVLAGVAPPGVAIPAGLHREERPPWSELRAELGRLHGELLRLLADVDDARSLEAKAAVEMVVKVGGQPLHWDERLDWKAFVQAIRVHTVEHQQQLERALARG